MSESIKSYRIRTNVGGDNFLSVSLEQDYDAFDILSLKIKSADVYRLHNSNYGVIVGRVLANNGFGIPNAKISVFIEADDDDGVEMRAIYPYKTTGTRDENGIRYNLLPDEQVGDCHRPVGTFPNKRYVLDNDDIIEVFDKYYKYTTRTNNSGDYMIVGVPTGNHTLHMDLDLSDCGILSQRPRDFVYKGYTIEQFENPNMFKTGTTITNLSQIFTQDQNVYVHPFWGNESLGETIGITRADIDVAFKFEPTCVFMGCIASDNASQGISKKCIPTPHMGDMDELTTGEGTIEMIRKTYAGSVEEFQVKGTELINGDGIWCYQIPMNLDYMITDEYGNMVPTDNPERGIPTRTRVRFRMSMQDMELNTSNYFRPKVLVPHNPQNLDGLNHEGYDYEFGTNTRDESFRDLFWNNVYTVKSYIPRFQKRKVGGWKEDKFTGIKQCQAYGSNNPIPYNNMRIKMPFMFKVMCILIKIFIKVVSLVNTIISMLGNLLSDLGDWKVFGWYPFRKQYERALEFRMNVIDEGLCPDLENWYFAPMSKNNLWRPNKKPPKGMKRYDLLAQTLESINMDDDPESIDDQNQDEEDTARCITINTDYLISCIEMNLAQEYRVINFDFYNDWINGLIYIPRFMRYIRKKVRFLGITIIREKVRGCMDDTSVFSKSRRYTQMCSVGYKKQRSGGKETYSNVTTNLKNALQVVKSNNLHKKRGLTQQKIFGKNGGIVHEKPTIYNQYVYYLKPCEWTYKTSPMARKVNLFATDIVLLGSLNNCDLNGVPQAFLHLKSSSYIMPTNLALTNMEESGPLYAYGDNGTMCSKGNQTTTSSLESDLQKPMNRVVPSEGSPLANELKYYSGASSNYDIEYDDPSDTIAMTEAAGIAWNYTGPGQGKENKKKLYYPGGHFLGISCVNSQTNIKSCVNLERICELGAAMSQRKEDVRAVSGEKMLYRYYFPTGLISGDDIIDDEFRTMFATMNKNRLIATKINPKTGYMTYDFSFSNPVNFSGELSKYTGGGTPYNTKLVVLDESNELSKYGVLRAETREDYDPDESIETASRTIEYTSIDYYMFRLGLSYEDLNHGSVKHTRQFAYDKAGAMYLPQYENSFYFYFGTKDGSTALDEFNKQFFSQCESSTISNREPNVYVTVSDFDVCAGASEVVPYITNLEEPIKIQITNKELGVVSVGTYNEYEIPAYPLPRGEYVISIQDSEGTNISGEFSVAKGLINGSYTTYDFNIIVGENGLNRTTANKNMFYGGYVKFDEIKINSDNVKRVKVTVKEGDTVIASAQTANTVISTNLYVTKPNVNYVVYVEYSCQTSGSNWVENYFGEFTLKDCGSTWLTIGPVVKSKFAELPGVFTDGTWWTRYDSGSDGNGDCANMAGFTAWDIRKALLRGYSDPITPFSNSVNAEFGTKAIWMSPQSIENGIYGIKEIRTSEYDEGGSGQWDIPAGYSVDDDYSHHPTYGHANYNKCYQNNAVAYNGVTVGGDFKATVTGQTGMTKTATRAATNITLSNFFRVGEGCMFKPLPDGDIVPAVVKSINGTSMTIECIDDGDVADYEDGIVYPTVRYPIINRPFSVNANYFIIQDKRIDWAPNGDGEDVPTIIIEASSGKCEGDIVNGVTYKKYFAGESYMTYAMSSSDEVDDDTALFAQTSDLTGITKTSSTDRKIYLNGWGDGNTDDVSYLITEGYPNYKAGNNIFAYKPTSSAQRLECAGTFENEADSRSLSLDANFYDKVYYRNNGGTLVFGFSGSSDSDIEYYVIPIAIVSNGRQPMPPLPTVIYEEDGQYITMNERNRTLHILGMFTSAAEYDAEGKEVIIRLKDQGIRVNAFVPWTEESDDSNEDDGTSGYVIHKLKGVAASWFEYGINPADMPEIISNIKRKSGNRVTFKNKRTFVANTANENDSASWTKQILEKCNEGTRIDKNSMTYQYNGDSFVVVGVKRYSEMDGMATGSISKVYMYPTKVVKNIGQMMPVFFTTGTTTVPSIEVDSNGGSFVYSATCTDTGITYTISSWDEWITITNGGTNDPNASTNSQHIYRVNISIAANTGEERTGVINVKGRYSDGTTKEYNVEVKQGAPAGEDPSQYITGVLTIPRTELVMNAYTTSCTITAIASSEIIDELWFTGERSYPITVFNGINDDDSAFIHDLTWRLNETDITNTVSADERGNVAFQGTGPFTGLATRELILELKWGECTPGAKLTVMPCALPYKGKLLV